MVDIAALADEITVNPLTRAAYTPWASQADDVRITADLSTVYRPGPRPMLEIKAEFLQNTGKWAEFLERAAAQTTTAQTTQDGITGAVDVGTPEIVAATKVNDNPMMAQFVSAVETLLDTSQNMQDDFWSDLTAACVTEGSMGASVRTAILALADNKQSRAQELFGSTVKEVDVQDARAL